MLSRVARRVLRVQQQHQQRCSPHTPAHLCALWPQQRCNGGPHKLPTYPVLWQVRHHMGHSHGNHSLPPVDREEEDAELESEAEGGDTTAAARVRIDADKKRALFVTNVGAGVNLGLSAAKAIAGYLSSSPALIADAVHSLSDLASDLVTGVSVHFSRKPADDEHPYGHGKIETIGTLSVAVLLVAAAGGIGAHSVSALVDMVDAEHLAAAANSMTAAEAGSLTVVALAVSALSVVAKEALFRWTLQVGQATHSQVLVANAWHHRTDALSSIVAFGGILGSMMGAPWLDPVAGLGVAAMIAKAGVSIGFQSIRELADEALDEELLGKVESTMHEFDEVRDFGRVRARRMGYYVLVDLDIQVDRRASVSAGHQVAQHLRHTILQRFPEIAEVQVGVHAEPIDSAKKIWRPHYQIDHDVRVAAYSVSAVRAVRHLRIHYLKQRVHAEMEVVVPLDLTVGQASLVGARVRDAVLARVPEVRKPADVDVHLELFDLLADDSERASYVWSATVADQGDQADAPQTDAKAALVTKL